jgi:hypothetical protein
VTAAYRQDPADLCVPGTGINAKVFLGICNASGTVSEVSHRQGVVTYIDSNGEFDIWIYAALKNIMEFKVIQQS